MKNLRYLSLLTCILSIQLKTFFPLKKISNQHSSRILTETKISTIKDQLDDAIAKYKWIAEIKDDKSIIVKVNLKGKIVEFFLVSIEQKLNKDSQKEDTVLVISNHSDDPKTDRFLRFNSHRIYAHRSILANADDQPKFIQTTIDKFKDAFKNILENKAIHDFYQNFKELIEYQAIKDVVLKEDYQGPNNILFNLISKTTSKSVAQVVIYSINSAFIGVAFWQHDDSSYFKIPVDNISGSNPEILRVFREKATKVDKKLTIQEVYQNIHAKIQSECPKSIPWMEELALRSDFAYMKVHKSGQTNSDDSNNICPFVDSDIIVTNYNHGSMQYFHIFYDSMLLKEEFLMVTTKDKFNASFDKAFGMIKNDLQTARKGQIASGPEKDLTTEEIKAILGDGIGESPTDSSFTEAEIAGCNAVGNKCVVKYTFPRSEAHASVFINADGYLISVTRIVSVSKLPMTIELSTPVKNSIDQKSMLIQHLKQFMNEGIAK